MYAGKGEFSTKEIFNYLKKNNHEIDAKTRIDVIAHGIRDNDGHQRIRLGEDRFLGVSAETLFKDLRSNAGVPLNVNLWSCHSGSANKVASSLGDRSTLITYTEGKERKGALLAIHSLNNSLQYYLNNEEGQIITPYQQFKRDLYKNFEAMSFSEVLDNGEVKQFKSMKKLTELNNGSLLARLEKSKTLTDFVNNFVSEERTKFQQFLEEHFPYLQDTSKNITQLTEEEAKIYALGTLIFLCGITGKKDQLVIN